MNPSRILIATPVDGWPEAASVTLAYHNSVRQLERAGAVILGHEVFFPDDLGRGRSRAACRALRRDDWDWLLWIDEDTKFDAAIVPRMLAVAETDGHEMIGAPYPRKRIPAQFPYKPLDANLLSGSQPVVNGCIEVDMLGFGFMFTRRTMIQKMAEHYAEADWWSEVEDGAVVDIVALFRPIFSEVRQIRRALAHDGEARRFRDLYGEDYSFCARWRAMGGKIQMYVGEGSPLGHIGPHVFVGTRDEIGNAR